MNKNIIKKTFANDDEWRRFRASSIGGSDIGTLLGLNKWCTPFQWLLTHGTRPESYEMHLGHLLEPAVAALFQESTGCEYDEGCEENVIYLNKKIPGFHATPDRIGTLEGERFVLEIKTTSMRVKKDQLPETWYVQLQQYLTILDIQVGYLAWLSAGHDFDFVKVERNPSLCEKMFKQALAVVNGDRAPQLELADIQAQYPTSTERAVELAAEEYVAIDLYRQNRRRIELLTAENDQIKARLMKSLGDASVATYGGVKVVTWRERKGSESFDSKAFKAEHPDLAARYVKSGAPTRVFRVLDEN